MTASAPSHGAPHDPQGGAGDPSMEDILASIRRILSEDEAEPKPAAPADAPAESDVVALDASMLVEAPPPAPPPAIRPPEPPPPAMMAPPEPASAPPPRAPAPGTPPAGLLAPETAAAASSSVGSLLRTLATERQQVAVRTGGPTIEDLVREELRPLLKLWLDTNLPPLVERLVRVEIERLVGRSLA